MAPLPPNSTARVFFDYITGAGVGAREHTAAVRYNPLSATAAAAQGAFLELLGAIGASNFRDGWKVLRVRTQAQGSNVTLPATIDPLLAAFEGTANLPTYNTRYEAVEDTFQGRSPLTGRRVDISLYRAMDDPDGTFRVEESGSGLGVIVGQAVAVLNNYSQQGVFVTVDATDSGLWYPYMNRNYNSYWERRARLG